MRITFAGAAVCGILLGTCVRSAIAGDEGGISLAELRERAASHVCLPSALAYTCTQSDSDGLRRRVEFDSKGTMFRVEVADLDVPPLPVASDGRDQQELLDMQQVGTPGAVVRAYNDRRRQIFDPIRRTLKVADGVVGFPYPALIATVVAYQWLYVDDVEWRLDEIQDPALWTRRFAEAQYGGVARDGGHDCVVVDFPDHSQNRGACIYRVYFAKSLNYAPLRADWLTAEGEELAGSTRVEKYKDVTVDGRPLVFPIRVISEQNTRVAAIARKSVFEVDESSLRVNEPSPDEVFTISRALADNVYDADDMQRLLAAAKAAALVDASTLAERHPHQWTAMVVANVVAALFLAGAYAWRRTRLRRHG